MRELKRVMVDTTVQPKPITFPTDAKLLHATIRRRSGIEPVIGHIKTDGHLGRCYLKGRAGNAANAVLSAAGYNLSSSPG